MEQQLALGLCLPTSKDLKSFIVGDNQAVLATVNAWAASVQMNYLFVHGAPAAGKSHLLQGACKKVTDGGGSALYLPLNGSGLHPEVLEDVEHLDALALDDIDAIAGDPEWEQGLFRLFNQFDSQQRRLLIAGRRPPAASAVQRADLRSRLCSGPSFTLRALDDDGLDRLLTEGASHRGFSLDSTARRYLLTRCRRDPGSLQRLLDAIDQASLAQGRWVTVPFLSQLLNAANS